MARKLKSDRVLFTATILLVCLSVVMVYSASAAVALDKFQRPYLFLIKQGMWAALGIGVLAIVMRIDYRNYREPAFIWSCLGVVVLALGFRKMDQQWGFVFVGQLARCAEVGVRVGENRVGGDCRNDQRIAVVLLQEFLC